ncbi:hypothetical protein GAMM_60015 [Gammaproteobacteria bacterium]
MQKEHVVKTDNNVQSTLESFFGKIAETDSNRYVSSKNGMSDALSLTRMGKPILDNIEDRIGGVINIRGDGGCTDSASLFSLLLTCIAENKMEYFKEYLDQLIKESENILEGYDNKGFDITFKEKTVDKDAFRAHIENLKEKMKVMSIKDFIDEFQNTAVENLKPDSARLSWIALSRVTDLSRMKKNYGEEEFNRFVKDRGNSEALKMDGSKSVGGALAFCDENEKLKKEKILINRCSQSIDVEGIKGKHEEVKDFDPNDVSPKQERQNKKNKEEEEKAVRALNEKLKTNKEKNATAFMVSNGAHTNLALTKEFATSLSEAIQKTDLKNITLAGKRLDNIHPAATEEMDLVAKIEMQKEELIKLSKISDKKSGKQDPTAVAAETLNIGLDFLIAQRKDVISKDEFEMEVKNLVRHALGAANTENMSNEYKSILTGILKATGMNADGSLNWAWPNKKGEKVENSEEQEQENQFRPVSNHF